MQTPAALIPDEGVHFGYFVFGGLVGAPHLSILIHCTLHNPHTNAKNVGSGPKTKPIDNAQGLRVSDDRKRPALQITQYNCGHICLEGRRHLLVELLNRILVLIATNGEN